LEIFNKKSLKAKRIFGEKINKINNQIQVQKKPTFTKFLYNKFHPFKNQAKENQDDFGKFNLDSSVSVLNKKQFTIPKNKSGSLDLSSYFDVLYKGAKDNVIGNSNNTIIENRVENTFKFNSEKVIDSVLRSNKHRNDDNNLNDSFKYIGFSPPIRKVKNIFKSMKSQESKDHLNSNCFINDEEKLNFKLFNNKRRHSNHPTHNKMSSILENTSISNNKNDYDFKNANQKDYDKYFINISNIDYNKTDKNNPSINSNLNKIDINSKEEKRFNYSQKNITNNLSNSIPNVSNYSDLNEDKDLKKLNPNLNKNDEFKKPSRYNSNKSHNSFGIEKGNNSSIGENQSEIESNNNQNSPNKEDFILKNIKLAKNYSRNNKKDNREVILKRNLKRKFHCLLNNDCQKFCEDLKNKNSNFNDKINNHLISDKYEKKLQEYQKNFHYRGMSYNPARYGVNLESIEKNFLKPENVISHRITAHELKIIQSDVNYYIKDKNLIKDNPLLKIKSLKDILEEEEEVEIKNRNKKIRFKLSSEEIADKKYQEKLKLIRSGSIIKLFIYFFIFRC
jgi:hypothetical protein